MSAVQLAAPPPPDQSSLEARVEALRANEGAAAVRLGPGLDRRLRELADVQKHPDFGNLPDPLKTYVRQRLDEGQAYQGFRDDLAAEVLFLLEHPDPSIRLYACRVLEGLGSRRAIESLVHALEDTDQTVAKGAWTALQRCSGLDLPFDPAAWRAGLARP